MSAKDREDAVRLSPDSYTQALPIRQIGFKIPHDATVGLGVVVFFRKEGQSTRTATIPMSVPSICSAACVLNPGPDEFPPETNLAFAEAARGVIEQVIAALRKDIQ